MDVNPGVERRVAFFGGSFDPPHLGHLAVARAARRALRLDKVLFAPVGAQPLKPAGSTAPFAHRVAMTELAIASDPAFELSLVDAPTAEGKPNYTLDTLRRLRAGLSPGTTLFCLMGADSFLSLRRWRGAAAIPFAAALVVASRPGQRLDDLTGCLPKGVTLHAAAPQHKDAPADVELRSYVLRDPAGQTAPFYLLPDLDVEISASGIREQASAAPDPGDDRLVPLAVGDYIRSHGLYREANLAGRSGNRLR